MTRRNSWFRRNWGFLALFLALAVAATAVGFGIYLGNQADNRWVNWCEAQHGHTVDVDRSMICVGADGRYLGKR